MTRIHIRLTGGLSVIACGSMLMAGCGTHAPAGSVQQSVTVVTAAPFGAPAIRLSAPNCVPEQPWWQVRQSLPASKRPINFRVVIGGDVLFETGSATLTAAAQTQLFAVLLMARRPSARVVVAGYTDDVPISAPGGNQSLSLERAMSVARWLEGHGVSGRYITVHGYGSSHPLASNATSQGRQENRRVVISVRG